MAQDDSEMVIMSFPLSYWSPEEIAINLSSIFSIVGALFLGLFVGYERSYRGRAAGMRTYGLVCMSSCAFIVLGADPTLWYGGRAVDSMGFIDPSRIIQGITTGIGFLGAGVIMRDGLNISGLTTAASIWTVATIGVLVGIGFHAAAIAMSILSAILMMWGAKLENYLPLRHAVSITLLFHKNFSLCEADITRLVHAQGYAVAKGSFSISQYDDQFEWKFVAVSQGKQKESALVRLGESLGKAEGIKDFRIAYARN